MKKDLLYSISCLAFAIVIGGAVYEHLNVVPRWAAGPPASLTMFQGEYGLEPALFWMIIHPVNILLFIVTLITGCRVNTARKIVGDIQYRALSGAGDPVYYIIYGLNET